MLRASQDFSNAIVNSSEDASQKLKPAAVAAAKEAAKEGAKMSFVAQPSSSQAPSFSPPPSSSSAPRRAYLGRCWLDALVWPSWPAESMKGVKEAKHKLIK